MIHAVYMGRTEIDWWIVHLSVNVTSTRLVKNPAIILKFKMFKKLPYPGIFGCVDSHVTSVSHESQHVRMSFCVHERCLNHSYCTLRMLEFAMFHIVALLNNLLQLLAVFYGFFLAEKDQKTSSERLFLPQPGDGSYHFETGNIIFMHVLLYVHVQHLPCLALTLLFC